MNAAVITSNSKEDLTALLAVAKKMGILSRTLSKQEMEDNAFVKAIEKGRASKFVSREAVMKELRKK